MLINLSQPTSSVNEPGMAISRRNEMPQQPVLICEISYVEAIATKTNDAKVVVDFLKFGVPKALVSDQGTHFCNRAMSSLLERYGVIHKIATPYHPQTNDQDEVFNREIKKTVQKMANLNRKDWSRLLEDALWAHRTMYRTPLGMSPYWIVFDKACYLQVEIEHKAY
ncbi:gag-pol, partial [Mucuna pruriens]